MVNRREFLVLAVAMAAGTLIKPNVVPPRVVVPVFTTEELVTALDRAVKAKIGVMLANGELIDLGSHMILVHNTSSVRMEKTNHESA